MAAVTSVAASLVPDVYVLWHPKCPFGEDAARRIYQWLRPGNGLGPRVFYRSFAAPESPAGGLPPALPGDPDRAAPNHTSPANLQIVLPLIDENMVADPAWRYWLTTLGPPYKGPPRRVIPIAVDTTAFNVPSPLRELNFLRLAGGDDESRIRSLLKQLTEALCRILIPRSRSSSNPDFDDEATEKLKVFISHAKQDGTTPAKRIRDYIYSQTQIAAFYDENDIPFGSRHARVIGNEAKGDQTVAMIAVRSAKYAHRPWCRRELWSFRQPRCLEGNRWMLAPVLVVDSLESGKETVGIPELGNAPVIRWAAEVPDQEEQIVTMLMRDTLLAAFHTAVGRRIEADQDNVVINFLPDPNTLLRIAQANEGRSFVVHYPGRGLSALEIDTLYELFSKIELRSFEGL
jgi:hypothetical protein